MCKTSYVVNYKFDERDVRKCSGKMKMRICTCRDEPTEVFVLSEEERAFFQDNPNAFLKWVNEQMENERSISEAYQEQCTIDELIEENKKLKEELELKKWPRKKVVYPEGL